MKIALVCDWYQPRLGGIERHLAQLATHLAEAGHAVTVVTPTPGVAVNEGPVRVRRLQTWLLPGARLMWTPAAFRRLGALIRGGNFDVVHVHSSIVSPAAYAAMYHAQAAGLATVSTDHSIWGGFASVARRLDRWFGWTEWPVVFSAVSDRVAREIRPVLAPHAVHVLPNAVDPREWRAAPRRASDQIVIACVMRLVPRKRGAELLRALQQALPRIGPRKRVELQVAGDGPERRKLERLAAELGLGAHVRFLGALAPAGVKALLGASDGFVLPSKLEAFGIAALEARAAGLPVIAMRESGVSEFVRDGREGLLAGDDAELAACLARLCLDENFRETIAAYNRATPVEFTWARSITAHLAAYEQARSLRTANATDRARAFNAEPVATRASG